MNTQQKYIHNVLYNDIRVIQH